MNKKTGRRRFIKSMAAVSANLALGGLGMTTAMKNAIADHHCTNSSWGKIEGSIGGPSGWNCDNHDGYKILEIFLRPGASQWESFWLPGNVTPDFSSYGMASLALNQMNWTANSGLFPCESPDIPTSFDDAQLFASQSGGGNIFWGAPTKPIYRRSDIFDRCRMITQYHDLLPHEAAVPYVMSGLTLGNPRRAGSGSAIQRRARAVQPDQLLPVSYVLHTSDTFGANNAAANGTHPGFAKPVVIRVTNSNSFVNSLARTGITSESDELFLSLRHEFRDRLRFRGYGDTVRSEGFDSYWVAAELLEKGPDLQALFADNILVRDNNVNVCPTHPGATPNNTPGTKTLINAAAHLLTSGPARYVCAIDTGIAGTYDSHGNINGSSQSHLLDTSANIYNMMHHLADAIYHPTNNPEGTINLDETMIVINTEFNRTPNVNVNNGRDHWPQGGVSVMIGGPHSGGPSILGAIDATGFTEVSHRYSATDMRGAVMLAAGIDPFAEGNFRFSDFSDTLRDGVGTEDDLRERLRGQILGL